MPFPIRPLLLALLAAFVGGPVAWAQGERGRLIEYAEPRDENSENTTLNPSQSRLGMLENDLNRPFQNLTPGRSLDGMMLNAPLPAPPPPSRSSRERDLNNKRWEWMYRSAEELMSVDSIEEKYKRPELTPDGRDRSKLRPMERAYYDAVYSSAAAAATNQLNGVPNSGYNPFRDGTIPGTTADAIPGPLNPAESVWQRSLRMNSGPTPPRSTDATDFSNFGRNSGMPAKPTPAQIRRAEQFMELQNFSGAPTPSATPSSSFIYSSPYVNRSFFETPKPQLATPAPAPGSVLGAAGLGTPSLTTPYATTPSGPARSTTPSSPFMNVTRGGF